MSVLFTKPQVQKVIIHHFPNIKSNKKVGFCFTIKTRAFATAVEGKPSHLQALRPRA